MKRDNNRTDRKNRFAEQPVAVLGGDEFVGSHLVEALVAAGARVRALCHRDAVGSLGSFEFVDSTTRSRVELQVGRVTDATLVHDLIDGADTVYYTAAHAVAAPRATHPLGDDHTAAAMLVLTAVEQQRVGRVVWTWTGDHARPPAWAGAGGRTSGPSVVSMLAAQRVLAMLGGRGAPVCRLAPCAVYGPRQPADALIPTMLSQLDAWMDPVTVPGPVPRQEYVYIDDLVAALLIAAQADPASYELRTGATLSISDVFATCCAAMQAHAGLTYRSMPLGAPLDGIDDELMGAGTRWLPGWTPRISIDEGVRRTADWLLPSRSPGVASSA